MNLRNADGKRIAIAGLLLAWCGVLIAIRVRMSFDSLPIWLAGNLLLASVPLVFSTLLQSRFARKRVAIAAALFGLWLLFLPNAPYIITDLIHLTRKSPAPLWFNVALLASCAATGVTLGYLSLIDVHCFIEHRFGFRAGWAVAVITMLLCGYGIYLGRYLRLNSWYLFTNPLLLAKGMAGAFVNPGTFPHPVAVTLVYGVGLLVGYIALRLLVSPERAAKNLPAGAQT